jgi:hypothetical protein
MIKSPSRLTLLRRVNNLVPVAYCIPCSGIPFPTPFSRAWHVLLSSSNESSHPPVFGVVGTGPRSRSYEKDLVSCSMLGQFKISSGHQE